MSTLFLEYVKGLRALLRADGSFPAKVEDSPVRASTRDDRQVICLLPGAEDVQLSAVGRSTRVRELLFVMHTSGDEHLDLAEQIAAALHPIVMLFDAPGIVQIAEHGTDEPKYVNGDLARQALTKRYRITYQTDEHSLSE